jgi:hypothetical protein
MFHGKIHERFGIRRTCSVCPVKRRIFAEFFFEAFPFFVLEIAKDNSGAFLNETPDDACAQRDGCTDEPEYQEPDKQSWSMTYSCGMDESQKPT